MAELSADRLDTLLSQLESEGADLFSLLKGLTLAGYYTSEVGATLEHRYVHVADTYRGDIPFDEIGRAYAEPTGR